MIDHQLALREEILRSNHALRDWAAGLRVRSRSAREVAQSRRVPFDGLVQLADRDYGAVVPVPVAGPVPALGQVEVSDLFVILIDQHGFEVMDAVRALATGLATAGYPLDHDSVSASDALDILHDAVNPDE